LLMKAIVSVVGSNVSVFLINIALDLDYLSSFIDNIAIFVSKKLPPS
jgi:hypothetical protein